MPLAGRRSQGWGCSFASVSSSDDRCGRLNGPSAELRVKEDLCASSLRLDVVTFLLLRRLQ